MQFNGYTAGGAHLAAVLVNSSFTDRTAVQAMFEQYHVHRPEVTAVIADDLQVWATRLRPVFEVEPAEQAARVNALLASSGCRPRLVSHDDLPAHLHYAPLDADLVTRSKALTAAGLAHLIAEGAGHRLGCCSREGCGVVFVDISRNGRRHFCSVRCANTVNVGHHRERQRREKDPRT